MAHSEKWHKREERADNKSELWVRTPYWDKDVEDAYQAWATSGDVPDAWSMVQWFLSQSYGVSFKELEGSYCVTLSDADRKSRSEPCLLSGWGGDAAEACRVVLYKNNILLDKDWGLFSKEQVWKAPRR